MSNEVWRSGPPPSIGWWLASMNGNLHILRWWDGRDWSRAVLDTASAQVAGAMARYRDFAENEPVIKWLPRPKSWPARSKT